MTSALPAPAKFQPCACGPHLVRIKRKLWMRFTGRCLYQCGACLELMLITDRVADPKLSPEQKERDERADLD